MKDPQIYLYSYRCDNNKYVVLSTLELTDEEEKHNFKEYEISLKKDGYSFFEKIGWNSNAAEHKMKGWSYIFRKD